MNQSCSLNDVNTLGKKEMMETGMAKDIRKRAPHVNRRSEKLAGLIPSELIESTMQIDESFVIDWQYAMLISA